MVSIILQNEGKITSSYVPCCFLKEIFLTLQSVVRAIERSQTDGRDRPVNEVKIADSGEVVLPEPISVPKEDADENA